MINEGMVDRSIRVILGVVLVSLVFIGPQSAWGWIGLVPLITGIIGFCPLYKITGLNTCPLDRK
jgi:Inner membrane protein YgaP-like, transmembrane domain